MSKNLSRLLSISGNALRQLTISAISMAIPFIVVYYSSKEVWGSFVSMLLFSLLALQIANWGNKEWLQRRFSLQPNNIRRDYTKILFTRLPILAVAVVLACVLYNVSFGFFLSIWLIGRYLTQSAEALVIHEKRFHASLVIEVMALVVFCLSFWHFVNQMDLGILLSIYSAYQFIKGLAYFLLFKNFFSIASFKIERAFFKSAFPFFLISLLAFLVSKVDVYAIDYFSTSVVTAEYQVINSLLVFVISTSAFIYMPFTKNIYRNSNKVFSKARKLVIVSGLIITPAALVCIKYILLFYLDLEFSWEFYVLSFLYVFPSFDYGIRVIEMFKHNRERTVILYLFIITACKAAFSILFLFLGYGILGALSAGAIAQMLGWYLFSRPSVTITRI